MISEMNLQIHKKMKSHREDKEGLLQCDIDSFTYFFGNQTAVLHLPMYNCTDMVGAIAYCKLVDEYVQQIKVYEAERLINVYSTKDGEWAVTFSNQYGNVIAE